MLSKEQMAEMSGENAYRKPKGLVLNTVTFDGKRGVYIYKNIKKGKNSEGKFDKESLGEQVDLVFLKIRRILSKFRKDKPSLSTSEHTSKDDIVMLYGANEKGKASVLREKYPELRTHQIVYAYLLGKQEMVRLVVKGASLGSNAKAKGVMGFYDYLGSFEKDEHSFEYVTRLTPIEEAGELGSYFAINFTKGEKIADESELQKSVQENLLVAFNSIKEIDEYYKNSDASKIEKDTAEERAAGVDTGSDFDGDDDINPEDIPF